MGDLIAPRDRDLVRATYAGPGASAAYIGAVLTRTGEERRVVWSRSSITTRAGVAPHVVMTGIDLAPNGMDAGILSHLMRAATEAACIATDLSGR